MYDLIGSPTSLQEFRKPTQFPQTPRNVHIYAVGSERSRQGEEQLGLATRDYTNMAEFQAKDGCPCTDNEQFSELPPRARPCEFELQLGVFSDRCSFRFFVVFAIV